MCYDFPCLQGNWQLVQLFIGWCGFYIVIANRIVQHCLHTHFSFLHAFYFFFLPFLPPWAVSLNIKLSFSFFFNEKKC